MQGRAINSVLAVAAALAFGVPAHAQGLRLMQECAPHLEPAVSEAPRFPAHGPYRYRVVVRFIVDIGGTILIPCVSASEFVEAGGAAAPVPDGFEKAFLAAFANWKYARQARPCSATAELEFGSRR